MTTMIDSHKTVYERDQPTFAEALLRAKADYLEMPGLQLTPTQAARFWGLDLGLCDAVLSALVEARFLICLRGSSFARVQ